MADKKQEQDVDICKIVDAIYQHHGSTYQEQSRQDRMQFANRRCIKIEVLKRELPKQVLKACRSYARKVLVKIYEGEGNAYGKACNEIHRLTDKEPT